MDFSLFGESIFSEPLEQDMGGAIANKYIVPPFSILNTQDKRWQTRKRWWVKIGIKSELGRSSSLTYQIGDMSEFQKAEAIKKAKKKAAKNTPGRGSLSDKTVWKDYNSKKYNEGFDEKSKKALGCYSVFGDTAVDRNTGGITGTSIFDPVLTELMYKWFCPKKGQILDPFCGGSVRGVVAALLGYNYWGCDLRKEQITANQENADLIFKTHTPKSINLEWVAGDSKKQLFSAPESDFIFTCPPYGDLEIYSDDKRDISNMPYKDFLDTYSNIISKSLRKLKENRFACVVVGDFRDKKGFYNGFIADNIKIFEKCGVKLYNEFILKNAIGSLPVRIQLQFDSYKKCGKNHQNVLLFFKGDPKTIKKMEFEL